MAVFQDPGRLKQPQGSGGIDIERVFRRIKAHLDMTLCRQIVDLVRAQR
jgi:hypothetical protein